MNQFSQPRLRMVTRLAGRLAGRLVVAVLVCPFASTCLSVVAQDSNEQTIVIAAAQEPEQVEVKQAADQDELYRRLAEMLTGSRWSGRFSVVGNDDKLKEETYEITRAKKAPEGDYWLLVARIKYGQHDVTLPLPPIEIKWAGQTPVITLDQLTIPGMGTFDARVLIRNNQYAGTWSHNKVGGHLFGTIEKIAEEE